MIVPGVTLLATLGLAFRIKDPMLNKPIALIKPTFIVGRHPGKGQRSTPSCPRKVS